MYHNKSLFDGFLEQPKIPIFCRTILVATFLFLFWDNKLIHLRSYIHCIFETNWSVYQTPGDYLHLTHTIVSVQMLFFLDLVLKVKVSLEGHKIWQNLHLPQSICYDTNILISILVLTLHKYHIWTLLSFFNILNIGSLDFYKNVKLELPLIILVH